MANPFEGAPLKEVNQSILNSEIQIPQNSVTVNDTQSSNSKVCSAGLSTPDRLKLPKPFKYPERYTSPTDHMISPISKGLLARSRRSSALLPPSKIQSKIHELRSQDGSMKVDLVQ